MIDVGQVKSDFQFIQNRLVSLSFNNERLRIDTENAKIDLKVDFKVESIEEQGDFYIGVITLHIKIRAKDDAGKIFNIKLVMEAGFGDNLVNSKDDFTRMLKQNGVSTLYSICRAYITSLTSLSFDGVPLRMPMINILKLNELKDSKETESK